MPIKLTDTSGAIKIVTQDTSALKARIEELEAEVDSAFTEGQQAQHDTFWGNFQQNGERTDYSYGFTGTGWIDENFRPKYNIVPTFATNMFNTTNIKNLKQILEDCGVTLDFSKCASFTYTFQRSQITHIGIIDTRSNANLNYFAPEAKFVYIEKLILKDDGSQSFNATYSFSNCKDLEHIIFEGTIGKNGLDLHWATKLDAESIISIINCLSTTATGLTVTLSQTAINNAFTSAEWEALRNKKTNWTISLI